MHFIVQLASAFTILQIIMQDFRKDLKSSHFV